MSIANMAAYNCSLSLWLGYVAVKRPARDISRSLLQTQRWEQSLFRHSPPVTCRLAYPDVRRDGRSSIIPHAGPGTSSSGRSRRRRFRWGARNDKLRGNHPSYYKKLDLRHSPVVVHPLNLLTFFRLCNAMQNKTAAAHHSVWQLCITCGHGMYVLVFALITCRKERLRWETILAGSLTL